MPILANLSRRLHMLTTDAKPDPPRVIASDNSHHNHTLTANPNETSTGSSVVEDALNYENSPDFVQKTKENLPSSESTFSKSANEETGKKPNPRTKKKTYSGRTTNIVNYNIVNSNGVKIGEEITYVCNINQYSKNDKDSQSGNNSTSTKSTTKKMTEPVKILSNSTNELTIKDMFLIKTHIDNNWRDIFKSLGYSKGQLDQFEENYKSKGMDEMIYQILLDWKRENGSKANIGVIVKTLWEHHQYDCAERLAADNDEL